MSDHTRISSAEQAAKDSIAASQKKVKIKNAQKATTQHQGTQAKGGEGTKKLQSSFDDMLDNVSGQNTPMVSPEAKFDSALRGIQHEDDDSSSDQDGEENEDKETKTKNKGEKSLTSREGTAGIRGRVTAKQSLKDQGEGGSSGRQDQQSDKSAQDKMPLSERMRGSAPKAEPGPAPSPIFGMGQAGAVKAPEATIKPRTLPKAVLDQIVQSVTIARSKELGKEIQIDFKDNFFNGLKLKVTAKDNEISIEFLCPNRDVEATFKNERDKIASILGNKDIDVRSINVTLG